MLRHNAQPSCLTANFSSKSLIIFASCIFIVTSSPLLQVPTGAWQELNQSLSGKLYAGDPLALPCYLSYNNGTSTTQHTPEPSQCASIQQNKSDPFFISDNFGGYVTYNFAPCVQSGDGCPLSSVLPVDPLSPLSGVCYQGCVPNYYIDARNVEDVQTSLAFAAKWTLPLVIKNTGHDYRGRSNAPNSFAIWTHNILPAVKLEKSFIPEGCTAEVGDVLTYGAGQQFQGLYDIAYANGYMIIGGGSPSVGASGGWVTGGGHSFASPTYGLGVDNVMQMRAVLPNGTFITANRCQNSDMFFALRGGGGGTFGVLMETTTRLYPAVPMQMASITALSLSPSAIESVLQTLIENAAQWAEDGWGGYVGPDLINGHVLQVSLVTPKLNLSQAKQSIKPLTDFAGNSGELSVDIITNITTLPSGYNDFINTPFVKAFNVLNNVGLAPSSRLIPKRLFNGTENQQKLLDVMTEMANTGQPNPIVPYYVLFVPPSSYPLPESDIPPHGSGASSVTPAWRNSLWHLFMQTFWDPDDPTASGAGSPTAAFRNAHKAIGPLRALTPDSGAYQNEADPFEPDFENSFWGEENYARLSDIKKAIDPGNLMTCYNCVGWNPDDERYSCYPDM